MLKSKEVVPRLLAAALAIGGGVYGAHELGLGEPVPSYSEQISKQLGASGVEATGVSVNAKKGTFTFHEDEGRYGQVCTGRFFSDDGFHVTDYDPSIDCKSTNDGPTVLQLEP